MTSPSLSGLPGPVVPGTREPVAGDPAARPAARDASSQHPSRLVERPLVERDEDDRLLAARLVASRRPGQWVSAGVVLVLFAMLVNTLVTNERFQWRVVGDYFLNGSVMQGLALTLWMTAAVMACAAAGKKPWTLQYFSDSAPIFLGLANGKVDLYFGPTLSLKYDAAHIAGTKFLGQISSTPVGFITAKNSPIAKALSDAVNELIANGDYAKIFAKWGVGGTEITKSTLNPPTTF